jgi:ABC-type Fe3+-hydroxamate transport system substrate-binding protein
MGHDERRRDAATRRDYLRYGAGLLGAGALAGCVGGGTSGGGADTTDAAEPTADEATETTTGTTEQPSETAESGPYTVSMSPMGDVEFEEPPGSVFTRLTHLAGMAFALGKGNDVNALHAPDYYDKLWNQFTPRLPGVELDWTGLYSSWETSMEKLYDLDSDVHLADPASVGALQNWSRADVDEVATGIAPWFGNSFSDGNRTPPEPWADGYRYYTLWEMFGKVSQVFREEARYEALKAEYDGLIRTIEENLPPESERPTAVMVTVGADVDNVYAYRLDDPGFRTAHTRPLEPVSAFGPDVESGTTVDTEALLDADPDVMLALGGMHPGTSMGTAREALEDDSAASRVRAVENDRVYTQGARYQGPVLNLFQLEMTAKQLYPDAFGAWPKYDSGPYPELPEDEWLFDRERVASAIRGAL